MNRVFCVHSMGRVGSRTLAHSLFGQGYAAVHTHNFNPPDNPFELTTRYLLRSYENFPKTRVWVISPVRDFVARNLSAYCHMMKDPNLEGFLGYPFNAAEAWFSKEIVNGWGADVFSDAWPFDKKRGWSVYHTDDKRVNVMIYQLEKLNEVWPKVWYAMTHETTPPKITRIGLSHTPIYNEWKIPSDYLDKVYGSLIANTFYSRQDIEKMRSKYEG